jgi:hypothetical protein
MMWNVKRIDVNFVEGHDEKVVCCVTVSSDVLPLYLALYLFYASRRETQSVYSYAQLN